MGVKVIRNNKKRKHTVNDSNENGDEAETFVIPSKKRVKFKDIEETTNNTVSDTTNGQIDNESGLDSTIEDGNTEQENNSNIEMNPGASSLNNKEMTVKYANNFKMLHFRAKLKGNDFITELKHFLYLASKNRKIVVKYIEKRGKPVELVEAMGKIDKSNIVHISYICEALELVLMEILRNYNQHMESAVSGCRFLLKAHAEQIDSLLISKECKHRKIALKLLTAVVCVDAQLGRQILATFNVLTNVKNIEKSLTHSTLELKQEMNKIVKVKQLSNISIDQQQQFYDIETVRKCFIHFVLSYLIDGNITLIQNILHYNAILKSLISGLVYDDAVTVCMVLNTLKKFVIDSVEISKTKKIHVFDLNCCRALTELYDGWRGPKDLWKKVLNENDDKSLECANAMETLPSLTKNNRTEDHEMVAKVVHELLLTLLTSRKNGIAFDSVKYFRQKRNTIQGKLIGAITNPWSSELKTELICKILEACPDLYRHTVRHYAFMINPIRCGQKYYVTVAEFLLKIISTCHPKNLKGIIEKITLTDYTYWIKDICLPLEALVHITGAKLLHHLNFQTRLTTNRLLLAMFQQYVNYMKTLQLLQQQQQKQHQKKSKVATNDIRKFKFDILNHLLLHFPTIDKILTSLNISVEYKHNTDVYVLKHMDVALDLLLLICQENPTFVSKTALILNFLELLRPLYADECNYSIHLEMKTIKTILLLSPKLLEPNQEQFTNILQSLIRAYVYGEFDISEEAGNLLLCVFKNTGIFDAYEFEIVLWLQSLHFFKENPDDINAICQVFNEVLKVTEASVEMPNVDNDTIMNVEKIQQLFENIDKGFSVQGYIESLTLSKLMPLIFKGVVIEGQLSDYLECVCLLMFHYYDKPEYIQKLYEKQFKRFSLYMANWIKIDKLNAMDYKTHLQMLHLPKIPKWLYINLYLFENNKDHAKATIDENFFVNETCPLNRNILMIYIQLILSEIIQLKYKNQLMCWQAEKASKFINDCLMCMSKELINYDNDQSHIDDEYKMKDDNIGSPVNFLMKLLKYIYCIRLQDVHTQELINQDDENCETSLAYLKFLKSLTKACYNLDNKINNQLNFTSISSTYKMKLIKALAISMDINHKDKYKKCTPLLKELLDTLNVFELDSEECLEILNLLSDHITSKDYFMDNQTKEYTFYYHLLINCFERIATINMAIKCDKFMKTFPKIYRKFFRQFAPNDINIDNMEKAFLKFIQVNHQYIDYINEGCFQCFLLPDRKLFKSTIQLCCYIYKYSDNPKLNDIVLNYLCNIDSLNNTERKELLYPLLRITFEKDSLMEKIEMNNITKLYDTFKNGFNRLIEKPQKSAQIYKECINPALKLIKLCMPLSECRNFCMRQLKFDCIELGQIQLIHAIYEKAFDECDQLTMDWTKQTNIFINYILNTINMLLVDIKTQKLTLEKCEYLAYLIQNWFNKLCHKETDSMPATDKGSSNKEKFNENSMRICHKDYMKILQSNQWLQFCKAIIKKGMEEMNDDTIPLQNDYRKMQQLLLKLLAYLIDHLYKDYNIDDNIDNVDSNDDGNTNKLLIDCHELGELYNLIFQHSRFLNIIFQKHHNRNNCTEQKNQLMFLLYILAKKYPKALRNNHIPIYLGAYQATLAVCDRYCLAILNLYEKYNDDFNQYKPFMWGESAINFYNIDDTFLQHDDNADNNVNGKVNDDQNNQKVENLNYAEATINQVMLLIDKHLCEYTIDNYPIWRKLQTLEQMPEIYFDNPNTKWHQFGNNVIERRIEMNVDGGGNMFTQNELRLCPKRYEIYEKCYDPAFILPLMSMLCAPDSYIHPARPLQCGLLSITLAALSSQDKQMRLAAGTVQLWYRDHFNQSHFFEKPLWLQIYNNIQNGLDVLRENSMKLNGKNTIPRVPLISCLFIAKTFNLTTEPTHPLYKQLILYLRLKDQFDFQELPDFNNLFYSSEIDHLEYRRFILQLIRYSIKSSTDVFLLLSTNTFKVLMECYSNNDIGDNYITTLDINLLILSIFSLCVKIPASIKLMINNVGIITWLACIINNIEFHEFDIIEGLITILNNIWYSLKATKETFHNYQFIQKQLHYLIVKLLPKLSARISIEQFCKLMNILDKTASIINNNKYNINNDSIDYKIVSVTQMKHLLECAEKHFDMNVIRSLYNIYEIGVNGCLSTDDYCKQLHDDFQVNTNSICGLNGLRSYLIKWWPINNLQI